MDPPAATDALRQPHTTPLGAALPVPVSSTLNAPPQHAQINVSQNEQGPHGLPVGIHPLCVRFLCQIQAIFGPQSREWVETHRALLDFKRRAMSKREALHIMTQMYGDNPELQQGLFDIMNHGDADWEPSDWSHVINLPVQGATSIPPYFAENPREPQFIQLPSVSEALGEHFTSRSSLSIDPTSLQPSSMKPVSPSPYYNGQAPLPHNAAGFEGYPNYDSHQEQISSDYLNSNQSWSPNPFVRTGLSSPAPLLPYAAPQSQCHVSSSQGHDLNLMPMRNNHYNLNLTSSPQLYSNSNYNFQSNPSAALVSGHFRQQHLHAGQHWQYEQGHLMTERQASHSSFSAQEPPSSQLASDQQHTHAGQHWQYEQGHVMPERQVSHPSFSPQEAPSPQLVLGQQHPRAGQHWQYEQGPMMQQRQVSYSSFSVQEPSPRLVSGHLSSDPSPSMARIPEVPSSSQDTLYRGGQVEPPTFTNYGYSEARSKVNDDVALNKIVGQYVLGSTIQNNAIPRPTAPPKPRSQSFIHGICGKGFHSRSAVKKHHWGPKAGDLTTTRGCWAKNNKPDVAWDDHASCKVNHNRQPNLDVGANDGYVPRDAMFRAPQAPSMLPESPPRHSDYGPTHGLDTLVSAASFAERIDAPQAQDGRNDSVVAHLDAQAAATERNQRILPSWIPTNGYGNTGTGTNMYNQMQRPTSGMGMTQSEPCEVPSNMTLPSQGQEVAGFGYFDPNDGSNDFRASLGNVQEVEPDPGQGGSMKRQRRSSKEPDAAENE